MHRTALVWFRRDLRLTDNPALHYALQNAAKIIPVFIHAPEEEHPWTPGAASCWWLHHSLHALAKSLRERHSRLVVRRGPTLATLRALIEETGATLVTWNRLYEPATIARDKAIKTELAQAGIEAASHNAALLFEPWTIRNAQQQPYRVFTPFWRAAESSLGLLAQPQPAPGQLSSPSRWPSSAAVSAIDELSLLPSIRWDAGMAAHWTPGEHGALTRLARFEATVGDYAKSRDRPDLAGTSSLSAHLHFGEIGPRQIVAALRLHASGAAPATSLATYGRELGWREFAHHLLFHFPQTAQRSLDERFEQMRWSKSRKALHAWQRGLTGYPIVDAGMRELWTTGWMHNRVRMIVASFLTKNLRTHWLQGARWFWDTLVDADLANNALGWQWTAGCGADAAPYYRVFNPVLQAEKFDPARSYIRRWIPELAALPDRWVHQPWAAPDEALGAARIVLGRTYPRPLVDLKESRDLALAAYQDIKQTTH